MKYFTITSLCSIFGAVTLLSSCDSGGSNAIQDDDTAEALSEIPAGTITFTSANTPPLIQLPLVFSGTVGIPQNSTSAVDAFVYIQTGLNSFALESPAASTGQDIVSFELILNNLLTGGAGNADLATEFRGILLNNRDDQSFSQAELDRLVAILNIFGADLTTVAGFGLGITTNSSFSHEITSTAADLFLNGLMGGVYELSGTFREMDFQEATQQQLAAFQLLQPGTPIPFLFNNVEAVEALDQGTWSLQL